MARLGSRFNITVLFIVLVYADPVRVRANTPAHTHVDLIVVAVGLVGATIGIAIHHFAYGSAPRRRCTTSTSGALTLTDKPDVKSLTLVRQIGDPKAGERIRVNGKQLKTGAALFLVKKVEKSYGACSANP